MEATKAQVADDRIITAFDADELALQHIPTISRQVDKCDDIGAPLLSVNKLCKGNLAVLFQGNKATVFQPSTPQIPIHGKRVLEGKLDKETEFTWWTFQPTTPTHANFKGG